MLRRSRLFLGFVAATLIWNLGFQISLPFFNVYLAGPLGASTTTIGLLNAVMPLTALFSQRWMGRLIDRRGNVWVLSACALAIPIFPVLWILVTAPWQVDFHQYPGGYLLDRPQPGRFQSAPRSDSSGGARRFGRALSVHGGGRDGRGSVIGWVSGRHLWIQCYLRGQRDRAFSGRAGVFVVGGATRGAAETQAGRRGCPLIRAGCCGCMVLACQLG